MDLNAYIAIISIIVAIIIGVVSWILSAHFAKKQIQKKELEYEMNLYPVVSRKIYKEKQLVEIYVDKQLVHEPTLLTINIKNTGNVPIENPPIKIRGGNSLIPLYIEDIPAGYEELWKLERTDTDECSLSLQHINVGQVVKLRCILEGKPNANVVFHCAMMGVDVKKKKNDTAALEVTSSILRLLLNL